ncbi:MAG: hypothetical protein FJ086_18200, partial [Deltaproteobacteria bacterium]|nr:hypothetical protein [Deltaproteobacteria bacterium]
MDRLLPLLAVLWASTTPVPSTVAHVVWARGAVTVERAGKVLPASAELPLERADLLRVPPGGLLVLTVDANAQVVRLDEDLELAVQDLAAVKAPASSRSVEEQLAALLSPRERESLAQQRLAGAVVRPVAAHVAAPPSKPGAREQLKARIAEQKGEREFDRRLDRLTRDDRLFDDSDRRMNLERSGTGEVRVVLQNGGAGPDRGDPGAPQAAPTSAGDFGRGAAPSSASGSGADARVQVGSVQAGGVESTEALAALEAQLRALEAGPPALDEATRACLVEALSAQAQEVKASFGAALTVRLC